MHPELALLSFYLGPVQSFIERARSVRDLWTGSAMLAWLTYGAIEALQQQYGSDAVISPVIPPGGFYLTPASLPVPSVPNRFLARVPWEEYEAAQNLCERAVSTRWVELCDQVRGWLALELDREHAGWDELWEGQVERYFEQHTAAVPLANSHWQEALQNVSAAIEARRLIAHFPPDSPLRAAGHFKCTMLGSFEQIGPPRGWSAGHAFGERIRALSPHGVRVQEREALSALAMVKRFAGPLMLAGAYGSDPLRLRFPDTATVAAMCWLEVAGIDPKEVRSRHGAWSGQWLFQQERVPNEGEPSCPEELWTQIVAARKGNGAPPAYFAILKADGDRIGDRLQSQPDLACYQSVTRMLDQFTSKVSTIIAKHAGFLVYAGGDDLLALLPLENALSCAIELREGFGNAVDKGTLSAGLAVVHHKADLREALHMAERAQKLPKKRERRDGLGLIVVRRSGEHSEHLVEWNWIPALLSYQDDLQEGASDRWVYHLRQEAHVLATLDTKASVAEIKRLAKRMEARPEFTDASKLALVDQVTDLYEDCNLPVEDFATLLQAAAFMIRGEEKR